MLLPEDGRFHSALMTVPQLMAVRFTLLGDDGTLRFTMKGIRSFNQETNKQAIQQYLLI